MNSNRSCLDVTPGGRAARLERVDRAARGTPPDDGGDAPGARPVTRALAGRRALITGITGQDGSYLAEQLVDAGYAVHGIVRPTSSLANLAAVGSSSPSTRATSVRPETIRRALAGMVRPDEIYHLAAPTFVPDSWLDPAGTIEAIAVGSAELLGRGPRAGARRPASCSPARGRSSAARRRAPRTSRPRATR